MNENDYMRRAFELAKKGRGKTLRNPLVGCVIVKDGKIIGEGYHSEYGKDHAEIEAFNSLKESAKGATLFVNLEPCSHFGKRPPCVDEIIRQNIKRVYISNLDTNPKVNSISKMKGAGIEVFTDILSDEGKKLNEKFFFNMKYKRPLIALKYAMTLDGKIATSDYNSKWISNEISRRYVHELRNDYDAILVGINTIKYDDPRLTSRIENGNDPIRIILDSGFIISDNAKVLNLKSDTKTYIATISDKNRDIEAEVIRCKSKNGKVDLNDLLDKLYELNIGSILVEGGSIVNNSFLKEGLVDKIYEFISTKIISGEDSRAPFIGRGVTMDDAYKFKIEDIKRFDEDIMLEVNNVHRNI